MSIVDPIEHGADPSERVEALNWEKLTNVYECRIALTPEEEGGFSVEALDLPGVISEGETIAEARENVREALTGAIAYYRENREEIPWASERQPCPPGAKELRILVNG